MWRKRSDKQNFRQIAHERRTILRSEFSQKDSAFGDRLPSLERRTIQVRIDACIGVTLSHNASWKIIPRV